MWQTNKICLYCNAKGALPLIKKLHEQWMAPYSYKVPQNT